MASFERDEIERSLKKKGFQESDRGKDHRFYKLYAEGKYTGIMTKISRGTKYKTLSSGLIGAMARQLKLETSEFANLIKCPLSYEAYLQILRSRGEL